MADKTKDVYDADNSILGELLNGGKGERTAVVEEHDDGSSDTYKADNSVVGELLSGGKGERIEHTESRDSSDIKGDEND